MAKILSLCLYALFSQFFKQFFKIIGQRTLKLHFFFGAGVYELGWNEKTEFHPYYADDPALKVFPVSERIVASAYTNAGRLMLVVLNDTDKTQKINVRLDLKKLKTKPGLTGHDAFEPGLTWQLDHSWQGELPPRGVRMIVFK